MDDGGGDGDEDGGEFSSALGMEPEALCLLDKWSTTETHPAKGDTI